MFSIPADVEITELHDVFLSMLGWQVKAEVWEAGQGGPVKDEIRLPANYYFRSLRAARGFVERMTKREIDRRVALRRAAY